MRPLDYLRILRRRWWILVVGVLIGSLFAFATRPSELSVAQATQPRYSFRATHLLIANPTSTTGSLARAVGYDRLALMTIRGEIPTRAMARLDAVPLGATVEKTTSSNTTSSDTGNSAQRNRANATDPQIPNVRQGKGILALLVKNPVRYITVAAVPDPATGALGIIATGDRVTAVKAANVFAEELLSAIQRLAQTDYQATLKGYATDLDLATTQAAGLQSQMALTPDPIAHNALQQRLLDVQRRIDTINSDTAEALKKGPQAAPLGTLEAATTERETFVKTPGGTALGASQRQLVGGAIGFFLALALLVIMELVGARIRDVAGTEGAARMPVIAEIPVVKMNRADRFVVSTAADPASLTAEAYRSLRTSLLAMWQRHPKNVPLENAARGPGAAPLRRPLRTLLVTSPGPAEGKSISVVNLAAAFAETGVTVIVIDADFRRPTQTRYFDRPRNPNLADIDLTCEPEDLAAILQDTDIPGVRLAASAPTKSDPGHAIAVAKAAVAAAVELADIVIVDSPPILLANDAADLALGVDASILLARSGWTRRSGVVSSAELLRRLEATVIGVVIVGAEHGARAGYYGYYGYYGYGYGYAHPGEVSIMHRLMPWKAAHKNQSGPRAGSSGSGSGSRKPPAVDVLPRQSPAPDSDDPWV
jgi:capsular exopolysaccharide family